MTLLYLPQDANSLIRTLVSDDGNAQMITLLNTILLGGLKAELDPANMQAILWTASVYANATIEYNTTFCNDLIRAILQKIVTVGTWEVRRSCTYVRHFDF